MYHVGFMKPTQSNTESLHSAILWHEESPLRLFLQAEVMFNAPLLREFDTRIWFYRAGYCASWDNTRRPTRSIQLHEFFF